MNTLTYTGKLVIEECCQCHITFAMPEDLNQQCRNNNRIWFYCPLGHQQHYAKSETTKLREELARTERQRDWAQTARKAAEDQAQTAEYRRRAAVGQVTKIRKRVANGVCPCCNRTFADLAAHMATKHPDFTGEPAVSL